MENLLSVGPLATSVLVGLFLASNLVAASHLSNFQLQETDERMRTIPRGPEARGNV